MGGCQFPHVGDGLLIAPSCGAVRAGGSEQGGCFPYSLNAFMSGQLVPLPHLTQWFSTFLMPLPLNTVPHIVVSPNHKLIFIATL